MINITSRLRHNVEVFKRENKKNILGENEPKIIFVKKVFAEIIPLNSTVKELPDMATTNEHKFKFYFRYNSLKEITKDYFFKYENKKYEVDYFNVDFKNRCFIEVFCILKEE